MGALDIGFVSKDGFDLSQMDAVYLMGADDFDMNNISKKAFVIYQGHHGDLGAHRADVILPGAAYTEKNGTYVNTEGRVQRARRAVFPVGGAREDWKIFRALSAYFDDTLPYDTDAQLAQRMITEWPHLGEVGEIAVSKWTDFGASAKIKDKPFENTLNLDNYYLSNSIARASATMMKCVEAFAGKQNSNEKKVA